MSQRFPMSQRFQNWRRTSRFAPVFFLFLIFGPSVILPTIVLLPAIVTLSAAWSKRPRFIWRTATAATIVLAFLITQPTSPLFWRLDLPIPPQADFPHWAPWLVEMQRPLLNAAIIASAIALPISAASATATALSRRKPKPKMGDENGG